MFLNCLKAYKSELKFNTDTELIKPNFNNASIYKHVQMLFDKSRS